MKRIAIASGHHNENGGNPFEYETVGRLCPALLRACRDHGMEAWTPIPDEGRGDFPGGIWDVARAVVAEAGRSGAFDIFIELHTQGVADSGVRGAFGIYPDWDDDVDADARDRLIPLAVRRISQATGIPVWSNGLMSERRTGVGLSGHRLGILNKSAPIKAATTRLLIEYGAHSNPKDARIQRTDAFYEGAARATAEAFAEFLGLTVTTFVAPSPPPAQDGAWHAAETGHWVVGPFLEFWRGNGGLPIFGFPVTGEYADESGRHLQYFERARFEREPGSNQVQLGRVAAELLETRVLGIAA